MQITNSQLEWTSEDIDLWRQFLHTQTGQRLIPKLVENAPVLLDKGDTNAILIRSGELRGMQELVRVMIALTEHAPKEPQAVEENYPDLHDDTKWNDGEKLNPKE